MTTFDPGAGCTCWEESAPALPGGYDLPVRHPRHERLQVGLRRPGTSSRRRGADAELWGMTRTPLALLLVATVAATAPPALAGPKPKPIEQQVAYSDATPDLTGLRPGSDAHCNGLLPQEKPYEFKAPAAGRLKVGISGFTGEWALELRDADGRVLAEQDVTMPEREELTVKLRKPAVVSIRPCNLAGGANGTISLSFTYA